jgi:hypothetical protein
LSADSTGQEWRVHDANHSLTTNDTNRLPAEEDKPIDEQGYYLAPELYGQSDERHIRRMRHPEQMQWIERAKDLAEQQIGLTPSLVSAQWPA